MRKPDVLQEATVLTYRIFLFPDARRFKSSMIRHGRSGNPFMHRQDTFLSPWMPRKLKRVYLHGLPKKNSSIRLLPPDGISTLSLLQKYLRNQQGSPVMILRQNNERAYCARSAKQPSSVWDTKWEQGILLNSWPTLLTLPNYAAQRLSRSALHGRSSTPIGTNTGQSPVSGRSWKRSSVKA